MIPEKVEQLLINTEDVEELASIVENGHPSIDETHHYWKAIKYLESFTSDEIIDLWNNLI